MKGCDENMNQSTESTFYLQSSLKRLKQQFDSSEFGNEFFIVEQLILK